MIAGDLALGVLSKFSCVVVNTWMRNLLANEHAMVQYIIVNGRGL